MAVYIKGNKIKSSKNSKTKITCKIFNSPHAIFLTKIPISKNISLH